MCIDCKLKFTAILKEYNIKYLKALEAKSVRALEEFRFLVFRVVLVEANATSDEIIDLVIIGTGHFYYSRL